MSERTLIKAADLVSQARKRILMRIVAVGLSLAFFTSSALIFHQSASAIAGVVYCGYEEHAHTDECYENVETLICQLSESGHIHSDACYEQQATLICEIPESEGHTHSDACLGPVKVLSCPLAEWDGHVHGADCYNEAGELTCGIEPGQGAHHHADSCYSIEQGYVCGLEESEGHHHNDSCYSYESVRICGYDDEGCHTHTDGCYSISKVPVCEKEEHIHILQCYSNPSADRESASSWERSFEDLELNGNPGENLVTVALTQLGYRESLSNFSVDADGVTQKGITRYGQWYGIPYGDWCAMFVSFCLNYAGIEEAYFPRDCGCRPWVEEFITLERFEDSEDYIPAVGDIVFFDWDKDRLSDHVGIVESFDSEKAIVHTIEGNCCNAVMQCEYELNCPYLLGYGRMLSTYELQEFRAQNTVSRMNGRIMSFATAPVRTAAPKAAAAVAEAAPEPDTAMPAVTSDVPAQSGIEQSDILKASDLPPVAESAVTLPDAESPQASPENSNVSSVAPADISEIVDTGTVYSAVPAPVHSSDSPPANVEASPAVETTAPALPQPAENSALSEDMNAPVIAEQVLETPVPAEIAYTIYPKSVYNAAKAPVIGILPLASTGGLGLVLIVILLIMRKQKLI